MKTRSLKKKIPDILTAVRVVGTLPALLLLCFIHFSPAIHFLTFMLVVFLAFSDYLDGWWARRFNCRSNFGKHFDPLADKWLASLYIPLVAFGMIHFLPVVLLWLRDITITDLRAQAIREGRIIAAHLSGKIKTMISFPLLCLLIAVTPVEGSWLKDFNFLAPYLYWVGSLLLSVVCLWSGLDYYIRFKRQE